MEYRRPVELTFRNTARNPVGLVVVSVLVTATWLPLLTAALLPVGSLWVGGLWTSCLLFGIVVVGAFRLTDVIAERGISLGTEYLWEGMCQQWRAGLIVGFGTFLAAIVGVGLFANPFRGLLGRSVQVFGVYVIVGWWAWAAFSLPGLSGQRLRSREAFAGGGVMLLARPGAALWLLVQTAGLTVVALATVVTPVLLLPGVTTLLVTHVVACARDNLEEQSEEPSP